MTRRGFLRDECGAAGTEFALILPLLIILMFVGSEASFFALTQHRLTEGVRNGARYASRLPIDKVCSGASEVLADPELAEIKLLTRTGQLADAAARATVKDWDDSEVTVDVACESFVSTGIYEKLGAAGPMVTVRATNVPYPSLFNLLGGLSAQVSLNAKSNSVVIAL